MHTALSERTEQRVACLLGVMAAGFALTGSTAVKCGVAGLVCLLPLLRWTLARAHRWIIIFLGAAILLPPWPLPIGDSGVHPALLFAGIGVLAGILARPHWRS